MLDAEVKNSESGDTVKDLIADPEAEFEDDVADKISLDEAWDICKQKLDDYEHTHKLKHIGEMYRVIEQIYRFGLSRRAVAAASGVNYARVLQAHDEAIRALSRADELRRLYFGDIIAQSYERGGVDFFRDRGESSVEWAVLKMESVIERA